MTDEPIRDVDGYELQTGLFQLAAPPGHRWEMTGGHREPDGILVLHIVVFHPDDCEKTKRVEIRLPISVPAHELEVGDVEVREL